MATKCTCVSADRLFRDIRAIVPSVTDEMVSIELSAALDEFCRRSLSVRGTTLDVLAAGVSDIRLADTGDGLEVIRIFGFKHPNGWIRPRPALRAMPSRGMTGLQYFWCEEANHAFFDGAAPADVELEGIVALAPGLACAGNCSRIPEQVYKENYEALRAGTLGRLYIQPGKAYTNLVSGRAMLARANARAMEARTTADQENTLADAPWRFPGFA